MVKKIKTTFDIFKGCGLLSWRPKCLQLFAKGPFVVVLMICIRYVISSCHPIIWFSKCKPHIKDDQQTNRQVFVLYNVNHWTSLWSQNKGDEPGKSSDSLSSIIIVSSVMPRLLLQMTSQLFFWQFHLYSTSTRKTRHSGQESVSLLQHWQTFYL